MQDQGLQERKLWREFRGHCLDSGMNCDLCAVDTRVMWCCMSLCFRMAYTGRGVEVKGVQLNLASV